MMVFAGVDIGTQGTKAALFDARGTLLTSAFRRSVLRQPAPGIVEEDPERQLESVCQTLKECLTKARLTGTKGQSRLGALAISGQMAGVVGIGADARAVTPYDSWLDTRCAPYIRRMEDRAEKRILNCTGGPASFNHGPKVLWWMHERPRVFKAIRAFVQPAGYAAMRLCSLPVEKAFIDQTYLHFSGFADSRRSRWNTGLCRAFSLDPSKLPRIVRPSEVIGNVSARMAKRSGVKAGLPVVAGCGDSAASFLACGATREGICVDVAGTASVFASVTRSFRPDRRSHMLTCARAATPSLWHPYAYINGGGMNLEWFRRVLNQIGGQSRAELTLKALDAEAERLPLSDDLPIFVPHMSGRVSPPWPALRGAWLHLERTHSAAHLWRSLLEGVALEYALYQETLVRLHPALLTKELRVTGGAARSRLWNQIKADVLGIPVVSLGDANGAAAGAALLAAQGVGAIRDLDRAAQLWLSRRAPRNPATREELKCVTRPDRHRATYYAARLARYQRALRALDGL